MRDVVNSEPHGRARIWVDDVLAYEYGASLGSLGIVPAIVGPGSSVEVNEMSLFSGVHIRPLPSNPVTASELGLIILWRFDSNGASV